MDGNGRWAAARGLPRMAGHRAGADAVRRVVETAPGVGAGILTLFAFSSDNWQRPPVEVSALMMLLGRYLDQETERCREEGVRLEFIGRRDRLPDGLRERMERAEAATALGSRLWLRIAVDYSSREAMAAHRLGPEVDLLIRTGGEQRLSDFLLWESAYAELVFTPRMWPDFEEADLRAAVREFRGRQRRFGKVPETALAAPIVARRVESWLD
jgi:undecaprenyl diphosphate synthase